jgi:hypothetical protein
MDTLTLHNYRFLNYTLLLVFATLLAYPLVAAGGAVGVKFCSGHCPSCGITRDLYHILMFKNARGLINPRSYTCFELICCLIASRLAFAACMFKNLRSTILADIFFTSFIFVTLYLLINKF